MTSANPLTRRTFAATAGAAVATLAVGFPSRATMRRGNHRPRIALIGVPYDSGGTSTGTAKAPAVLRHHGLIAELQRVGAMADFGDIVIAPSAALRDVRSGLIGEATFLRMLDSVTVVVGQALADRRFPVLVGGDCPILLGALASLKSSGRVPGLLFIDGHEDAYGPHESPTGETADMELAFAIGIKTGSLSPELAARFPLVRSRDAIILGARDEDVIRHDGTKSIKDQVTLVPAATLANAPMANVRAALHGMSDDVTAIWLHTDLDVLSTKALPAVDYHLPGGLSWAALTDVVKAAVANPAVVGWDITIYNPDLDPGERSARRIVEFIVSGVAARANATP